MKPLETLQELRTFGPPRRTVGLPDEKIERFAADDVRLQRAIDEAVVRHRALRDEFAELLRSDEIAQIRTIQESYVNFYAGPSVNPYVALAADGPWIVTLKGAVLHDNGGYGMLGLGHVPKTVIEAMSRPQVMANIMTSSISQLRFARALRREIGHRREGGCPFTQFACLNSGSEAVTLAARLSDVNAKLLSDPGGRYEGRNAKVIGLSHGFHGRTDRPARFSDSSRRDYRRHLASFRGLHDLIAVEPNDIRGLREAYDIVEREGAFVEAVILEPVMGEGNPGLAMERPFYDAARELTREREGLLIIDSIQAGLRAHGCLSVVDYPGFEDADAPDAETYSKALNAGQYPLSVLAASGRAAELYRTGIYGNTMTTNPRAMDVAVAVLETLTPELRANIRERGVEMADKLRALATELDGPITDVQGTGLLLSCELDPGIKCHGTDSVEESMRLHGIGVIHGGENSLRYTPHFGITSEEIDLVVAATRDAILRVVAVEATADRAG
jgi:acetylornithine/succinyldiaminopimelate/putrescine aminotransferase